MHLNHLMLAILFTGNAHGQNMLLTKVEQKNCVLKCHNGSVTAQAVILSTARVNESGKNVSFINFRVHTNKNILRVCVVNISDECTRKEHKKDCHCEKTNAPNEFSVHMSRVVNFEYKKINNISVTALYSSGKKQITSQRVSDTSCFSEYKLWINNQDVMSTDKIVRTSSSLLRIKYELLPAMNQSYNLVVKENGILTILPAELKTEYTLQTFHKQTEVKVEFSLQFCELDLTNDNILFIIDKPHQENCWTSYAVFIILAMVALLLMFKVKRVYALPRWLLDKCLWKRTGRGAVPPVEAERKPLITKKGKMSQYDELDALL